MIKDMVINDYLEALSSKQPTPGGGGAAALAGAQGVALGEMVINLTLGKKKYIAVEGQMKELMSKLTYLKTEFIRLADEDAKVFIPLAAAYRMPGDTKTQKAHKALVMERNLIAASLVPITVMERAAEALEIFQVLARNGSRMAVSDVGVGVEFVRTALTGAVMNVLINTKAMEDNKKAQELNQYAIQLKERGMKKAEEVYQYVEAALQ